MIDHAAGVDRRVGGYDRESPAIRRRPSGAAWRPPLEVASQPPSTAAQSSGRSSWRVLTRSQPSSMTRSGPQSERGGCVVVRRGPRPERAWTVTPGLGRQGRGDLVLGGQRVGRGQVHPRAAAVSAGPAPRSRRSRAGRQAIFSPANGASSAKTELQHTEGRAWTFRPRRSGAGDGQPAASGRRPTAPRIVSATKGGPAAAWRPGRRQ